MTETTRVPLQPIAKGALLKLWVGIAGLALIAGGIAWAAMPHSVEVSVLQAGKGGSPGPTDVIFARYVGKLADGTVFGQSSNRPSPFSGIFPEGDPLELAGMIKGFREGAQQMKKGGKYLVEIPAERAYGANPPPDSPIPVDADLTFEVELVEFMSEQDFQQRVQTIQQLMQMQGGAPNEGMPPQP